MKYRVETARKLIQNDDNIEPSHLFSANVLRVAKRYRKKLFLGSNKSFKNYEIGSL